MADDRQRAIALKAADARTLLQKNLPYVLHVLAPAQLAQVQRVLDAEVVNPEIAKQANEVYRKSVTAQSGNLVVRDERTVHRAYRIMASQIKASESDHHIRLDYKRLLTVDALKPATDNPDEAEYLGRVRNTLENRGIWLRFDKQLVHDPEDPSRWIVDPRTFLAWLSVGYDGDSIPTNDGQLDREELLGTVLFGAGYYDAVHRGPTQRSLDRQIAILSAEMDSAIAEHHRLIMRKVKAPIVSGISDFVGGADLPDRSIWDQPQKLLIKALEMNKGGNVFKSPPYLVVAAILTRNNANLLSQYADDSASGAGRVVTVLKVAKTAGQVAEVGLAITGVTGIVRGTVSVAGGAAAGDAAVDAAAERMIAKHYAKDAEIMADLNKVKWVPQPKGSVAGGVKPGTSSGAGTGWHKW
ncbi:hypothetical protein SAMN02990966_00226 [Rhodospirillales bacterium URHD0017]|nr:hypothetical protein SAMN02990966_00226 [Rhodospirillales bacterium URHD0017]